MDSYAARDLKEVEFDAIERLSVLTCKHEHVVVVDFFFAVGQFEECFVCLVKFFAGKLDAEYM